MYIVFGSITHYMLSPKGCDLTLALLEEGKEIIINTNRNQDSTLVIQSKWDKSIPNDNHGMLERVVE